MGGNPNFFEFPPYNLHTTSKNYINSYKIYVRIPKVYPLQKGVLGDDDF